MIIKKEVEHIAKLARLGLTEKEKRKFQKELSSILDYFNLLKEVDVSKVKPTSHFIFDLRTFGREDEVKEEPPEKVNKLINVAPEKEKRYIKVKAIL